MIVVPPIDLGVRQQRLVDQRAIERDEGERLETEILAFAALDPCIDHQDEVFDADAVFTGLVIARFVGEDHAFAQRGLGAREGAAGLADPLGPLVHGEKAPDTVAGAMAVIDPAVPEVHARQRIERAAAGAVGEFLHVELDVPLEHARVALDHFGGRLARTDPHGAGDVGRPVEILAARIDEIDRRRRDRDIAVLIDLVMRQRGMARSGADRIEAGILQLAARLAELAQLGRRGQFVDAALGCLDAEPAQEARHGRPVARLCIAMALLFGRVLDRLGQDGGIVGPDNLRAAGFERMENTRHCLVWVDRYGLSLHRFECGYEIRAVAHGHRIAEMLRQFGRDLVGRDEQFGRAIGMRENVGQCDRGVVDIAATHVEQPGDRIERAYNSSVIAFLLEPVGHLGALVGTRPAGVRIVMRHRRCQRGLGPVGPDRVDRVAVDRDQFDSFLGEVLLRLFGPADAVEPCVVADLRSLGRMFGDPLRGRGGRHVLVIV